MNLGRKFLQTILIIVPIICAQASFAGGAMASPTWDFTGIYQPYSLALRQFDGQFIGLSCQDKNDLMYEAYAQLHPQFRPLMANKELRKRWRQSLIKKGDGGFDGLSSCFYKELLDRWWSVSSPTDKKTVLYCGKIAEELNEFELDGASAIAEIAEYALMGRSVPVTQLIQANSKDVQMRLNEDILYYLQLNLKKLMNGKFVSQELTEIYQPLLDPDAGKNLSPEKRKFLDEAFKRGDHRSVLEATAPCQSA